MAEWFKAAVLKTAAGASPPWVRIPLLPPMAIDIACVLATLGFVPLPYPAAGARLRLAKAAPACGKG
jgi:hypothetical protein